VLLAAFPRGGIVKKITGKGDQLKACLKFITRTSTNTSSRPDIEFAFMDTCNQLLDSKKIGDRIKMESALSGQTETFGTKVLSQDFICKPTILQMVLAQHCLEDGLTLMCFSQENFFAEHPPLTTVVKKTHYKNTGPSLVLDTVERNEATNNFWSSLLVITEDKREYNIQISFYVLVSKTMFSSCKTKLQLTWAINKNCIVV